MWRNRSVPDDSRRRGSRFQTTALPVSLCDTMSVFLWCPHTQRLRTRRLAGNRTTVPRSVESELVLRFWVSQTPETVPAGMPGIVPRYHEVWNLNCFFGFRCLIHRTPLLQACLESYHCTTKCGIWIISSAFGVSDTGHGSCRRA